MIKFNNSDIIDWNFDDSNIIKVCHNGAVVFYKFDTEQGGYKVCYAVVDDITKYSDREFEDVYDKATDKWYKLNNLNRYEEYGVYGSGRTSCEGSTSRLPQGYTEVEYIRQNSNYNAYINTGVIIFDNTTNAYTITTRLTSEFHSNLGCATIISCEALSSPYNGLGYRYKCSSTVDQLEFFGGNANYNSSVVDNGDGTRTVTFQSTGNTSYTTNVPLSFLCSFNNSSYTSAYRFADATIYSSTIIKNGITVRDFVPAKRDSDSVYGLYDLINNVFYTSPNGNNFIGGEPVTPPCVTTYEGKLTIDDGYEYEWNGSSWVNLGEVSGSSRVPIGYTEVEYIQNTGTSYLNTNFVPNQDTRVVCDMQNVTASNYPRLWGAGAWNSATGLMIDYDPNQFQVSWLGKTSWTDYSAYPTSTSYNRHTYDLNKNYVYIDEALVGSNAYTTRTASDPIGVFTYIGSGRPSSSSYWGQEHLKGKMYSFQIYDNGTLVRYLVPCKRDNDNTVGAYDIVNDVFYTVPTGYTTDKLIAGAETGATEYPKYYSEKSEPLDNLTFNTLAEAQAYAEANCVYDGMHATIGADRYYFDSDEGWVVVPEYYIVEDVTPNKASGWTITGSATYNPDSSYYDDFDLETTSTSSSYKIAKVTIYGYDNFTYYLRSSGYSTYSYVMASNIDELSTDPTSMGYNSNSAITNTYNYSKSPGSVVNLSNYRRVTYNNLDKTVEHTFYVVFYGRTYSSYVSNATILIPKEQTNENWEQVTFSASSNVASTVKSLYIDNSYTSNGGTSYFYYRWMVGLPAGSHSSYTNYSNYNYCPNVTSSTFTSVAGEQRQVNFTYDNATNKTLSFRLTDGSNVLAPSDTVYFNMTYHNSCGVSSSSSNVTFPRSQSVKIGGRFRFANSSNRHYIYGYSPNITLNTDYYVDNYQSTFDITYIKLSEEAVTVTYTTYDPSDAEVPAFKTDITWPYSGGTTSSTTLASYSVPYTYSYKVSQTNNKFSADSQTYTAGQSSRAISFVLYPNNREFATVADMEAYAYAWEGMKATVGDTKYKYENGEWVENQHSLPDVPFTVNYNAKQYNASTKALLKTEGQLADVDAVITAGTPTVNNGYLTIASSTRATISGYQNYFSRDNNNPNLTIISKQRTDGNNGHMFANRDSNYNWMYRCYSNKLTLHGSSEQGAVAVTTQPVIESVRVNSSRLLTYNNYTNNTSSTYSNFNYGGLNNGKFALFAGYASSTGEWFVGDFYWVYMCQGTLTDEQVQQVIDYNENL